MPDIPVGLDRQWDIPELAAWYAALARRHSLVTWDPPGVGLSSREAEDVSFGTAAVGLKAIVDALELEQFDLFSAYRRTPSAIAFAAENPSRVGRLILWCPYAEAQAMQSTAGHQALANLFQSDWTTYTEYVLRISTGLPATRAAEVAALARDSITKDVYARQSVQTRTVDVAKQLAAVRASTLVLHRRDVSLMTAELSQKTAASIPGAQFSMIEGESLYPFFSHPESALAAIIEFLDGPNAAIEAVTDAVASDRPNLASQAAPDGTVTILFSDIEGSTALNVALGDRAWIALLDMHNRLIREAIQRNNGFEVKTEGDAFMVAFRSARDGLRCAIDMQRSLARHSETTAQPIRVRIGLHTGEPIRQGDDFFGTDVVLAARIAGEAVGNEILVSGMVSEMVAASREFILAERPSVSLNGLPGEYKIYAASWE